jgi:glycosyltransferase involved in cell wall biosynthesis
METIGRAGLRNALNDHPEKNASTNGENDRVTSIRQGSRLRVGVDLHVLEGKYQGSRTHCLELFSRVIHLLPEMDFFFFVDTSRWDKDEGRCFTAVNATVVSMPHANSLVRLALTLPRLASKYHLDLLHTQYVCPLWGKVANAVTIHDILFEDFPQYFEPFLRYRSKILFRRSARLAKIVCTVSNYSKQKLAQQYKIKLEDIVAVSNGADLLRFFPGEDGYEEVRKLGLTPGEYVLAVGRLEPRKNHLNLLRAFACLDQPRPKLLIVGQRDFAFAGIFRLREALHLQDDVQFLETANDRLLAALYRHSKVFLYPTFAEGFGMPVLEAMASGVPVISSDTTSLPEIAGDAALYVKPDSVDEIAQALRQLLSDGQLRAKLRGEGRKQAGKFNWNSSAQVLASAYRDYFASSP